MEFIDLTSASEDEKYRVKGILSNASRNLEFTCGKKLPYYKSNSKNKSTSKRMGRISQNGNRIEQNNCKTDQTNKSSTHSSSNASPLSNNSSNNSAEQSLSIPNCSSTSSNDSSLRMNGYQYNGYYSHHSSNNYSHQHHVSGHQLDASELHAPTAYSNVHPSHYNGNHYQASSHPNAHSSRMQPVISYPPHFISHNGALPPSDHPSAQYHHPAHQMPYHTAPTHHFTSNSSSKSFYQSNHSATAHAQYSPHNTVLTNISPIVADGNGVVAASNQLHLNGDILNQTQPSDLTLNNSNNSLQPARTNASNEPSIVNSSPYPHVTYNLANGVSSNPHPFVHHTTPSYISNAHLNFAHQPLPPHPNVPMYFLPFAFPQSPFYTSAHYVTPQLAAAQPPTLLTAVSPHQSLATPPISPQQNEESIANATNCDNVATADLDHDEITDVAQLTSHAVNSTLAESSQATIPCHDVSEQAQVNASDDEDARSSDEEKNKKHKHNQTVSSYDFMSPQSLEQIEMLTTKNDGDMQSVECECNENANSNQSIIKEVDAFDESASSISVATQNSATVITDLDEATDRVIDNLQELSFKDNGHDKVESQDSSAEAAVVETEKQSNDDCKTNENNNNSREIDIVEATSIETSDADKKDSAQNAQGDKVRCWADLFKGESQSKIVINHTSNINNNLFDTADFEPLGQIDSIVKSSDQNLQRQTIKSVPVEEDDMFSKLAKKLRDLKLKHSLPFLVPRGFRNQSNWCYINAILQALLICPPFYNLMREIAETPSIFRDKSATPIIDSFAKFFTNFMPNEQLMKRDKNSNQFSYQDFPQLEPYEPKCIYNVLGNINNECLKGKQEDAEEFLSSVLNCLHDEMLLLSNYDQKSASQQHKQMKNSNSIASTTTLKQSDVNEDEKSTNNQDGGKLVWKEVRAKHKTFISSNFKNAESKITEIFGGTMLFIKKASGEVNHSRQPFFTLKLDIQSEKVRTVEDALRSLTVSELIHGYQCPKTNKAVEASYQTFLDQLPAILVLHLKVHNEDQNGQPKKSMKKLNFPIDLEMPKECLTQQDRSKYSKTYKLLAVVHHEGKDAVRGHYFTDIFHIGTSLWLRCDDSKVEQISLNQLMHPPKDSKKVPYLLFYRRCDTLRGNKNQN